MDTAQHQFRNTKRHEHRQQRAQRARRIAGERARDRTSQEQRDRDSGDRGCRADFRLQPDVLRPRDEEPRQEVAVEPLLVCGNRKNDQGITHASHGNLYKQMLAE